MRNLETVRVFLRFMAVASMAGAFLCPAPASAVAVGDVSIEELAHGSDVVVRGMVRTLESRLVDEGRRVVTLVDVAVLEDYTGENEQMVQVLVPGGVYGDLVQTVSATPAFFEGEEVVLFLELYPSMTKAPLRRFSLRAMAVGAFFIEGDRALRRMCGLRPLVGERWRQTEACEKEEGISVERLEQHIREAIRRIER